MTDENYLQSAMLLDLVGQAPITINRAFVDLTGNVLTALWLSYAVEKGLDRENGPSFVLELSASDVEKDTGITRPQQQTCRRTLAAMGLLTEEGGKGRTLKYRVHLDRLMEQLQLQAQPLAAAMAKGDLGIELATADRPVSQD
ncbi:hypothetical protein HMPREF9701_01241 [Delftia acidovorans CCUG 274B]|uniref:hypothetical protein n=1 Tax=Delftia TaxID=80865 RepID=UPI0003530780|nr:MULTISPECIES: hypothetical protein [Delftia]EPD42990.1 hypothetical protein HMPREF9701_01241 [Delftia acidovorans CCUG 274B]PZP65480.1 MAG: hypothetical protein DI604_24235 [Delftia acidovorans]